MIVYTELLRIEKKTNKERVASKEGRKIAHS